MGYGERMFLLAWSAAIPLLTYVALLFALGALTLGTLLTRPGSWRTALRIVLAIIGLILSSPFFLN
jgi:hypothetical protein